MIPTLAFCNDADFASWPTYLEARHVLAEEFGFASEDSFWLFDPGGSELALFGSSLARKGPRHEEVLAEIHAGRLAVLHSAGDFSHTHTRVRPAREMVREALAYLKEHARVPAVWTNHGDEGNLQNIGGAEPTYHHGDDPASPFYILDLLLAAGIEFFWTDHHATNTFALPRPTDLVVKERTRAGPTIACFFRYRGALKKAPDAQTLAAQVTREHLDALIEHRTAVIIYQHWHVHRRANGEAFTASSPIFPEQSLAALRLLADFRDRGLIRVVRVTELLKELVPRA